MVRATLFKMLHICTLFLARLLVSSFLHNYRGVQLFFLWSTDQGCRSTKVGVQSNERGRLGEGSPPPAGWGPGGLPGKFLENCLKNGAFWGS